jgi:xylan 1,4-beta-xylosidase
MGRAYELLRADASAHLGLVQKAIGFEWCRFHGLFHDDMMVAVRLNDGSLRFQWGQVDKVLDSLLQIGLRPFVELGSMPGALASGPQTFFYWKMNVTPPKEWEEWGELVEGFTRHCVDRYGLEEVRRWRFEVWNEPNLEAFWSGTQEQYWRLYQTAALAVKRVDPHLKVGGPASAEARWVPEFLAFCRQTQTPVDFVSSHLYPQNEWTYFDNAGESPYPRGTFFSSKVTEVTREAKQLAADDLEVHWTEWNALSAASRDSVDWLSNPTIDGIGSAACTVRNCLALDDGPDSLFWWVATDVFEEAGMPQSPFSNTYGLVTVDGLPKPAFHAFHFLAALTGDELALEGAGQGEKGAVATRDGGRCVVLLWNDVPPGEVPTVFRTAVKSPAAGLATIARVRVGSGSAYEAWVRMGSPQNPTAWQMERLRIAASPEMDAYPVQKDEPVNVLLEPGEIQLIEFAPAGDPVITKDDITAESERWNVGMGL